MGEILAQEIDLKEIKKRALVGVTSLVSRSFLIQLIAFGSTFLLTIFLDPKVFGIFYLVTAFVSFFSYFSDIGLAAALIQKKESLEEKDLRTTFTVQQILVLSLITIIIILVPFVRQWYQLSSQAVMLLYAIALSFFLSSLKTIPSIILERELRFNLLIIPQILETLVFNLVAVILAWKGFGLSSFTWAVLSRGVVGLVSMYIICPWKIGISFSKDSFSRLLKFGLPYQANTVIAVVKDDLMTIFLGKIIGTTGLGYLGWAKKWSELPLRFLMDNVSKVAFPAFSRMQHEKESLKNAVEKSVFFLCFLTFPILMGFSILSSDLVQIIPRYLKWQPALLALYFYSFNSAFAVVSTPMTNLLNAIGQIKKTFKLMLMWLALTWGLMPILGLKFGYNGVALATAIIAASSIVAVWVAKKEVNFNLWFSVGKPLLITLIMGGAIYFIRPPLNSLVLSVLVRIIFGFLVYLLSAYLFFGNDLLMEIKQILYEIKKKK